MATPTKMQWIGYPLEHPASLPSLSHVRLPNPSASGDTIILVGQYGAGTDIISSITDDQGNTWTKDKTQADTTNGQSAVIARASNVAANTRVITINFSSATDYTQFNAICVNNLATVSPVDGTPSGQVITSAGTSLTAGNITTTQANDFVVVFACEDSGTTISSLTTYTAETGYTLWAPDGMAESCAQYGIQQTANTINPAITASHNFTRSIVVACAYKTTSSSGSGPSGVVEAQFCLHQSLNGYKANFGALKTFTWNVPCESDITGLCMSVDDGNNNYVSMSDSLTNTWTTTTAAGGGALKVRHHYVTSATVSKTMTVSHTLTNTPSPTTQPYLVTLYGIRRCGAFDASQSGSGTLASVPPVTSNNVLTTALTTATANELIIFYAQQVQQSITGITSTNGTALPLFIDTGQYESLVGVYDGGPAIVNAASATTYNFNVSYSNYEGGLQVDAWAAQAVAFKTAPVSSFLFRGS